MITGAACISPLHHVSLPRIPTEKSFSCSNPKSCEPSLAPVLHCLPRRRALSLSLLAITFSVSINGASEAAVNPDFFEIPDSGGIKALDLRIGYAEGDSPVNGDQVAIHYYGRLAAKQGWRFDSTYDHKDETGEPIPFIFTIGSGKVIPGIETAVRSMKVGGIRRVIIPPSQGYQNMSQEPIPPNFFDRQRLFTTIFNPTRLANGEGSTLGILIFDIELVSLRHQ